MIFVDTSFWVALTARGDAHHREAIELISSRDELLLTSNHVRGETWTFLNQRYGHPAAVAFLDRTDRSEQLEVEFVPSSVEADALAWLRGRDERAYSFVDATSFALMRSMRIEEALAFDGNFAAAGLIELRA